MIRTSRLLSSMATVHNIPRHSRESDYIKFRGGKKTFSEAYAPLCYANSVLRYFGIINCVDDVIWSPLKFSKLAFRALALPQNEIFLRHLF